MVTREFFSCHLNGVWGSYDGQTIAYRVTFHSSQHLLYPCTTHVVNGSLDKTLSSVPSFISRSIISFYRGDGVIKKKKKKFGHVSWERSPSSTLFISFDSLVSFRPGVHEIYGWFHFFYTGANNFFLFFSFFNFRALSSKFSE